MILSSSICRSYGQVTTAGANAPAYLVGANVYSTSTLYTTSYYVITECAPNASNCPTNALEVVTSVVFASSTTTVCLTTDLPQAALPPVTGTLPSYAFTTTTSKPAGSNNAPYPGASSASRADQLPPVSSFSIPLGPGPEVPRQSSPSLPYIPGSDTPSASYPGSPSSLTLSNVPTSPPGTTGPLFPAPGYSNTQSSGLPSLTVPLVPGSSVSSASSVISPGASSYNPIPGVPPRPHPSSDSLPIPSYGSSSDFLPSTGPQYSQSITVPIPGSTGSFPSLTNPTWNPSATGSSLSSSGPTLSTGHGGPSRSYVSISMSLSPTDSSSVGGPTIPTTGTAGLSSLWTGPVPVSGSGGLTITVPQVPTFGVSTQYSIIVSSSVASFSPPESSSLAKSSPYVSRPAGSVTSAAQTSISSVIEGTTTTPFTSVITLPHTTFVYTVPAHSSSRNYSTETLGIHTSIGTDASAYIPTGSG